MLEIRKKGAWKTGLIMYDLWLTWPWQNGLNPIDIWPNKAQKTCIILLKYGITWAFTTGLNPPRISLTGPEKLAEPCLKYGTTGPGKLATTLPKMVFTRLLPSNPHPKLSDIPLWTSFILVLITYLLFTSCNYPKHWYLLYKNLR